MMRPAVAYADGDLPLPESKLRPPPVREGSVPRTALLEALRPVAHPTVALVAAPAGYGKTTLLAQVAAGAGRKQFAWLTLDEQDNDPNRLVAALAAALVRAGSLDEARLVEISTPRAPARATAKKLAAAVGEGGAFGLAIDDLHCLRTERSIGVIQTFAAQLPPRSRLLIAGRTLPPDALAEPRDGTRIVELGREELRMSDDEASVLFGRAGVAVSDEELRALVERLEGWPTGLYLAALVLENDPAAVGAFDGSDRFVTEYFREECLAALEEEEVAFLRRASVLDRLSGGLCDSALRGSGSATRLKRLARSTLFLIPLTGGRARTYRLHPALRDALLGELQRREPGVAQAIAARAADWATRHGDDEQAVGYAWAAGLDKEFAMLIERSAPTLYHEGGLATIERWLLLPTEPLFTQYPALALWRALIHLLRGRDDEAVRWLDLAGEAPADPAASIDGTPLQGLRALILAALCRSGLEGMRADASRALESLGDSSPWRPAAVLLLGVTHVLAGDDAAGGEVLSEAQTTAAISGMKDTFCVAVAERALLEAAEGRWVTAEALATNARSVAHEAQLDDYATSALTYVASARSAVQRSDWVRARTDVERTVRLLPLLTSALPWLSVQVRLELARTRLELSEHEAASAVLAEAEELLAGGLDLGILGGQVGELRRELDRGIRPDERWEHLTPAELRLLPLLTTHLSFREIAEILGISRNTVKTQAIGVYRKLGVSSRSAAIDRASELGLVEKPGVLELPHEDR
jgi:LuxR family transcriptional regulator, maltose regulon positive regulatory protein